MNNIKERLEELLGEIETDLKAGDYLRSEDAYKALRAKVEGVSAKSRILNEEDQDFVIASKIALNDRLPWM